MKSINFVKLVYCSKGADAFSLNLANENNLSDPPVRLIAMAINVNSRNACHSANFGIWYCTSMKQSLVMKIFVSIQRLLRAYFLACGSFYEEDK